MSVSLPNGSTVKGSATLAASTVITAITNAVSPVVSSVAHGLIVGDYVILASGWSRLNNKVFRVLAIPTVDTFTLEGVDTTNVVLYPVGASAGTAQKVLTWTPIQQIMTTAAAGGDQQFYKYQFLDANMESQLPTVKNVATWTISIADDVTEAGYQWADTSDAVGTPQALMVTMASGAKLLYLAHVSLNKIPSMTNNQAMEVKIVFSLLNQPVRYST